MIAERKPVDALAFGTMVLLCMLWGFQPVTMKLAAPSISLVMQSGIRSILATLLLLAWAWWRGIPLFGRDGTLGAGIAAGLMFGFEFFFIYGGLQHTGAARMTVFVNTAPCLTALGLAVFIPGERLGMRQWVGILMAFSGVALAFAEGFSTPGKATLLGDAYGFIAALLWAATTVLIRTTRLASASAEKTLFYQLLVSAILLPAMSVAMGEPGVVSVTAGVALIVIYQAAVVAFASYLAWFWLLTKYLAARLKAFVFLSPMFGVVSAYLVLGEPLTAAFLGAAALVAAGIVLVNLPGGERPPKA
jgi:drug/metabolite transporter (DMT)-like permease